MLRYVYTLFSLYTYLFLKIKKEITKKIHKYGLYFMYVKL